MLAGDPPRYRLNVVALLRVSVFSAEIKSTTISPMVSTSSCRSSAIPRRLLYRARPVHPAPRPTGADGRQTHSHGAGPTRFVDGKVTRTWRTGVHGGSVYLCTN